MHAPLTPNQLAGLPDTTHPTTGISFPPLGLSPYHDWLLQTLHRLSETSLGALLVSEASASPTTIHVAPGLLQLEGTEYTFAGGTFDLAAFNNGVALAYLHEASGEAVIAANAIATGWPITTHLPLARVILDGGAITQLTDLRLLPLFTA